MARSTSKNKAPPVPEGNPRAKLLSARYLDGWKRKNDLTERLENILRVLREEEVDPDHKDYRHLPSLCQALIPFVDDTHPQYQQLNQQLNQQEQDQYQDKKQIRLYTIAACMELFAVCAPEAPWTNPETLQIFRQCIRQLASLAHTTTSSSTSSQSQSQSSSNNNNNNNFAEYSRILHLLAEVKIGVILVDLTKEERTQEEALPVLSDLFRVLLQSVRPEHPASVAEMMQSIICGCLEEFHDGIMLPIPLMDEILLCIGQGPKSLIIDPAKARSKHKKKRKDGKSNSSSSSMYVEQTNPSYIVASSIVRNSVDRLSTPIAALLNGLLNHDARLMAESKLSTKLVKDIAQAQTQDQQTQADIFNVIFELHRVSPTILTTIVGNLTNFLILPDPDQRKLIVQLLGKLFKSPSSFATKYRPCFRQWLERSKDKDEAIRSTMLQHLLQLIPAEVDDISWEAQSQLVHLLNDPVPDIRLQAIHGICEWAFQQPDLILLPTWTALGRRVHSKHKQERKDALTGLVQTYYKHHIRKLVLADVQAKGDDAPLDLIVRALDTPPDERLDWIPSRVLEAASVQGDVDLRNRLWQVVDTLLLGSELPNSSKKLNPTARAVGLAKIVHSLEANALAWLGELCKERAHAQSLLQDYLQLRQRLKGAKKDEDHPEVVLTLNAQSLSKLEQLWNLVDGSPLTRGGGGGNGMLLQQLQSTRNKRILRILQVLAQPSQSLADRIQVLDDLSKSASSSSSSESEILQFVKKLVRRCSMGDFINTETIYHCTLLAQESAAQEDWSHSLQFLQCVDLAVQHFPQLGASSATLQNLVELFKTAVSEGSDDEQVVTVLCKVLATCLRVAETIDINEDADLQQHLELLCQEGTPVQARHAMQILTSLSSKETAADHTGLFGRLSELIVKRKGKGSLSGFAALSALVLEAPEVLRTSRGRQTLRSVLKGLLAKDILSKPQSTTKGKRKKSLEEPLEVQVQCAALDFLVTSLRSLVFETKGSRDEELSSTLSQVFGLLVKLLTEQVPGKVRECAAVNTLTLCDARLGLDREYLTQEVWIALSGVFVDQEVSVRDRVLDELSLLLTGNGKYGSKSGFGKAMIPSFKLAALVALCVDSDHGSSERNAHAANVGRRSVTTKMNASAFVLQLRKIFEVESARARDEHRLEQEQFERRMKVRLMPEYIIPYAYYLLAVRPETPSVPSDAAATPGQKRSDEVEVSERVLRKRLKWILDPIVLTAGDDCGNVSFLLCITDKLMNYAPVQQGVDTSIVRRRLQFVCSTSRKLLLSYVKKDVNLVTFPGQIHIPNSLFKAVRKRKSEDFVGRYVATTKLNIQEESGGDKHAKVEAAARGSIQHTPSKSLSPKDFPSASTNRSHGTAKSRRSLGGGTNLFLQSGDATRGSTPPSIASTTQSQSLTPASPKMPLAERAPDSVVDGSAKKKHRTTRSSRSASKLGLSQDSVEKENQTSQRRSARLSGSSNYS